MATQYDIDKFISTLCEKTSSYNMEKAVQIEMQKVDKGNVDNIDPMEWQSYCQSVYDIYGYLIGSKFRNFKPSFQPLVDKLKDLKE